MVDYPHTFAEFERRFATEEDCRAYLAQQRWPGGFRCPRCGGGQHWLMTRRLSLNLLEDTILFEEVINSLSDSPFAHQSNLCPDTPDPANLSEVTHKVISLPEELTRFRYHPLDSWVEYKLEADAKDDGQLKRRVPRSLPEATARLSDGVKFGVNR